MIYQLRSGEVFGTATKVSRPKTDFVWLKDKLFHETVVLYAPPWVPLFLLLGIECMNPICTENPKAITIGYQLGSLLYLSVIWLVKSWMERRYRECDNHSCITLECDRAFQPIRPQESGNVIKANIIDQSCVFWHIFLLKICAKI